MNVLSLFDGMSGGQIALERAGINVSKYYAAELDKYAITVTQANYPDTIQLGDVTKWRDWDIDWSSIDLLIGGSPCQGFSFAGKQLAFDDPRSKLFFVYVDILNHIKKHNPDVKFMLENVRMKKEYLDVISDQLGVEPVFINSALLSAQNRQRYYWANWEFGQPEDKGIVLADILEGGEVDRDKSYCIDANYHKGGNPEQYFNKSRRQLVFGAAYNRKDGLGKELDKAYSLNASDWRGLNRNQTQTAVVMRPASIVGRRLNERGVREDYNKNVPITQYLQVKHNNEKMGCLTTVQKDAVISPMKPGRYPLIVQRGRGNNPGGLRALDGETPSMTACSWQDNNHVTNGIAYRKLTPTECEALQTVPRNYTAHVSNTQRYKMLGNGWTVDVIAHIFKGI